MRVVAVSRIFNEEDIVEAFVRHHATMVDRHVLIDGGSNDRTRPILRALRDAMPDRLELIDANAPTFCETLHNTFLYRRAVDAHRADWVCFLDADEFVALADGAALAPLLAMAAPDQEAWTLNLHNYVVSAADNAADAIVPRRLRHRLRAMPEPVGKVFVRGGLGDIRVLEGNHMAVIGNRTVVHAPLAGAFLAHYQQRVPVRSVARAVVGRLKVLAAGGEVDPVRTAAHYSPYYERLLTDPRGLLATLDGHWDGVDLVEAPIDYRGGALTEWLPFDPETHALQTVLGAADAIARAHGRLLDENAALRLQRRQWSSEFRLLE